MAEGAETYWPDAGGRLVEFRPGRSEMLELLGLPQSDKEWLGPDLNDLDDWHETHLALLDEA